MGRVNKVNLDFFHKVVYINLKERTDRNITLKKELREIGINESKLVRFNAIENELGYLGCTQSHIFGYKNGESE